MLYLILSISVHDNNQRFNKINFNNVFDYTILTNKHTIKT